MKVIRNEGDHLWISRKSDALVHFLRVSLCLYQIHLNIHINIGDKMFSIFTPNYLCWKNILQCQKHMWGRTVKIRRILIHPFSRQQTVQNLATLVSVEDFPWDISTLWFYNFGYWNYINTRSFIVWHVFNYFKYFDLRTVGNT